MNERQKGDDKIIRKETVKTRKSARQIGKIKASVRKRDQYKRKNCTEQTQKGIKKI